MDKSVISVIIPIFHVQSLLHRCLDSIISQVYSELQITLVDDGSYDGSGSICDEYAAFDSRILVIHKSNGGLSSARNAGMMASSAKYITFVDGDDYIERDAYTVIADAVLRFEPDLLFFREKGVDINGNLVVVSGAKPTGEVSIENAEYAKSRILGQLDNSVCDKVYNASLIKELRFITGKANGEDYLFNALALKRVKKVVYIDQIIYNYVINPNSITRASFTSRLFDQFFFKDMVSNIAEESYPEYIDICKRRAYASRLYVCRPIYSNGLNSVYKEELYEIDNYLRNNRHNTKLELAQAIEYSIYLNCKPLYRLFLRILRLKNSCKGLRIRHRML